MLKGIAMEIATMQKVKYAMNLNGNVITNESKVFMKLIQHQPCKQNMLKFSQNSNNFE